MGWSEDEQRAPPDGDLSPEGINPEPPVPAPGVPGPPPLVPPGSSPLGVRLQALFEVVVCSDFPTQLFVGQVLVLAGIRPFTADHRYSATFILTLSLADAVLLVGLVVWFLLIHGERPLEVLFGRRAVWREALVGVLLTPVVFLIAILVLATVQQFLPSLGRHIREYAGSKRRHKINVVGHQTERTIFRLGDNLLYFLRQQYFRRQ